MSAKKTAKVDKHVPQKQKRLLFYVIAITLPFILLLAVEGALRLSGFGHQYPLFIQSTYDPAYLQPNPDVVKRFFHKAEFAPPVGPDTYLFKQKKEHDTLRIVLMGGSSAAGFPYGRFGSPAGMLHQRVKSAFAHRDIEIISVAMASINSYALLDFVDEVIEIEPDAVLIYAGHNEYLGVMGVGSVYASTGGHASNLIYLKVKDLRLFQLVQRVYYAFFDSALALDHSDGSRTVMASVAKEKEIAFESELFLKGREQFTQNMNMITSAFVDAGINTYVSTIASNEKDFAPFSSSDSAQVDALLQRSAPASNRRIIQQGSQLLDAQHQSATLAYTVAQAMREEGDIRALDYFTMANDYDLLRFRAPSSFNSVINNRLVNTNLMNTKLANKPANENDNQVTGRARVIVVDSEQALRDDSEDGIIGAKHMLEHLHPTPRGYFIIADAYFRSLMANGTLLPDNKYSESFNALQTRENAWKQMPLTVVDTLVGAHKIQTLISDYPFTKTKQLVAKPASRTAIEKMAERRINGESWLTTQQALLSLLQRQQNIPEAAKAAGLLYDALPNEHSVARAASLLYLRINDLGLAEYYARKALLTSPNAPANFQLTLAEIMYKSGDTNAAVKLLDSLLQTEPDNQRARAIKQQIQQN